MIGEQGDHRRLLDREGERLLDFATASAVDGGFGWLDARGTVDRSHGIELWITCRMTHCFALAQMRGRDGAERLVDHGVMALMGPLRDRDHGGWFARTGGTGGGDDSKLMYAHAFVILAASSAGAAGHPDAQCLLDHALAVTDRHFWDEQEGLAREAFGRRWDAGEDYRGVNANMHLVEAYLAAADVTGRDDLRERARRITERVIDGFAREGEWLLPEHYTAQWEPHRDYNASAPAHPFRPYGVTMGHLFEWARLTLNVEAATVAAGHRSPPWALEAAGALYRTAVEAGWAADGAPGFVYTTDFDRRPVVRERMHWVVAEAIGAAAALWQRTGDERYAQDYAAWWDYARQHLIDQDGGSWHHELEPTGAVSATVWDGKPDIYHAYQATLFARSPLTPSLAAFMRG